MRNSPAGRWGSFFAFGGIASLYTREAMDWCEAEDGCKLGSTE